MAKKLKCSKCDRSFSMPAHLARHMSTHASPKKKAAAKKKRGRKKAKNGRRRKRTTATRGLRDLPVEALSQLIVEARSELRRRLAEIKKAIS